MAENTSSKNIKLGAILTYITQFLNIAISFVYVPLMMAKLGQTNYGLYSLVQSLISYLQMSEMGLGVTATRYNAKYIANGDKEGQKGINGMFLKIYVGIAAVCALIGGILYFLLDRIYAHYDPADLALIKRLFVIAIINLVIVLLSHIFNSIITAYEKFVFLKLLKLIQTVLGPAGMLAVLYLGAGAVGMLWVTTAFSLAVFLVEALYCLKKFGICFNLKAHDGALFRKIFSFTVFVFVNSMATQLMTNSDKVVISLVMPATVATAAVAVFGVVMQFHTYSYNFTNVLSGFYLPRFTKSLFKENGISSTVIDDLCRTGRIQILIAGLIFGGFLAIGKPFILRWVGAEYQEAYLLTLIILFAEIISAAQSMFNSLMQAMNLHKMRALLSLCVSTVKIVLTVLFTRYWGLLGCAVAFFIGFMIKHIVFNIYYKVRAGIPIGTFWLRMLRIYIPQAYVISILSFSAILLQRVLPATSYPLLILYAAIYTVFYIGLMWIFALNKEERTYFLNFFRRRGVKKA